MSLVRSCCFYYWWWLSYVGECSYHDVSQSALMHAALGCAMHACHHHADRHVRQHQRGRSDDARLHGYHELHLSKAALDVGPCRVCLDPVSAFHQCFHPDASVWPLLNPGHVRYHPSSPYLQHACPAELPCCHECADHA